MKKLWTMAVLLCAACAALQARTLVVYYSFTNNVHTIVGELQTLLPDADVLRIEPAEEGLDYAADGYALGSALISAIRENPDDASSYPAIKPVEVDVAVYDEIIVAAPLWWSNMAAPMQTFLFHHGGQMAGKRIGLIVSSASSGISGVEADARRLIPGGDFVSPSLWIRSAQTANCRDMIVEWLGQTGLGSGTSGVAVSRVDEVGWTCRDGVLRVSACFDRLDLYDATGSKVLSTTGDVADVSDLPGGVYLACLRQGAGSTVAKVAVR